MITVLLITLICAVSGDESVEIFQKLSYLNDQWLQLTSIPEVARLLQQPPYSYHSKLVYNNPISHANLTYTPLNVSHVSESSKCSDDLVQILYELESSWALQMLDSDGKLSSGLLRGGIIWPGHFQECISVYSPEDDKDHGDFNGQYCVTTWNMYLGEKYSDLPLTVGLCVPDSCTAKEILVAGNNVLHILERFPILNKLKALLTLTNVVCKERAKSLDTASIVYLLFISLFIAFTLLGTIVALIHKRKQNRLSSLSGGANSSGQIVAELAINSVNQKSPTPISNEEGNSDKTNLTENDELDVEGTRPDRTSDGPILRRVLLCFSAFDNGLKILNVKQSEGQLQSIHGIRFLSLTWVILGHTYISSISLIGNRIDVLKEMDNLPFQMLLQAPFSVDSFFLLSGFLLSYLFLKECSRRNGKMNWAYFYIHRYWRLTPVYMIVVFFYLIFFKFLGSGPFWDDGHCDADRGSWWKYFIYINNFIPIKDMCLGWSWYLANDMQFYIISPLFLYPLWRWPPVGLSLLVSILIGTWTTTGILSYQNDLIPMFVGVTQATDFNAYATKMWNSFDLIYDKPYCRIAPYIVGVFLGFVLHRVLPNKNFLKKWQQAIGWLAAIFFSSSVVFGLYHVRMSRITALFYNSLCRTSFAMGLAWLIFACETGHGGFINKFLSWKFFIPLSRLTYCTYLIHPILIHGYYQALQTALYFTEFVMVTNFFGFLIMSFGIAFAVSIVFESPLMNLEKLLMKMKKK